jgi:hypothetical protein
MKKSIRRHQHRKRHVDKLLILAESLQCAEHIAANFTRATLFDLQRQLHVCDFEGQWVLIDPEQ